MGKAFGSIPQVPALTATPPGNPPSGALLLYFKSDGKLYQKDSAGVESPVDAGGGGEPAIAPGTTAQYWRGDKTWATLLSSASAAPLALTGDGGTTSVASRSDHRHPLPTPDELPASLGDFKMGGYAIKNVGVPSVGTDAARKVDVDGKANAVHGHALTDANITGVLPWAQLPTDTTAPSPLGTAAAGTATTVARRDHVHAMPTAAQVGAAASTHGHALTDANITGVLPIAKVPVAASGVSSTTQVVRADDARLSDARTPTSHLHTLSALVDLTPTPTELDRVVGVTSPIQTQLNGLDTRLDFLETVGPWKRVGTTGNPAYANGWADFGTIGATNFRVNQAGDMLTIAADVAIPSNVTNGSRIFTLPLGYRPTLDITNLFGWQNSSGVKFCLINVGVDGQVTWWTGGNTPGGRSAFTVNVPLG